MFSNNIIYIQSDMFYVCRAGFPVGNVLLKVIWTDIKYSDCRVEYA